MALFEFNLPKNISKALGLQPKNPRGAQLRVLKKLLKRARYTAFGQKNKFDEILTSNARGSIRYLLARKDQLFCFKQRYE
jgi:hypothetical protein